MSPSVEVVLALTRVVSDVSEYWTDGQGRRFHLLRMAHGGGWDAFYERKAVSGIVRTWVCRSLDKERTLDKLRGVLQREADRKAVQ